ncbi:hypothetical protein BGZ61DRAFT_372580 [Ilyonectria robusta]|uniref:uncharacterized protein n=1 Tax=Ilyonectria robusta TaxID=1079257 RepID=UPI001E8D6F93|nr:uncharacterized protein BGZ61DRAFT_372580 [Ilyonectria robusta]KAH8656335.1 hypothetical protein BGZ61DRAFT_372580 [Ilyonectria robusta]
MAAQQDFSSKYTNANLSANAAPYDSDLFANLVKQLEDTDGGSISKVASAIVAVVLCAQKRGDAVAGLFRDITRIQSDQRKKECFMSLRHGISLTWPFFGLPNSMPACLGLVNELRQDHITVPSQIDRSVEIADWLAKGYETNRAIYHAVGNAEVGNMIAEYFPEISYIANAAVFGFLIGGSENIQTLPLSELIVASAIAGTGATRQTKSHFKGSLGLGISPEALQAVWSVVKEVAAWNKSAPLGKVDVLELVEEVKANLQSAK